jgi:hypothetical protein
VLGVNLRLSENTVPVTDVRSQFPYERLISSCYFIVGPFRNLFPQMILRRKFKHTSFHLHLCCIRLTSLSLIYWADSALVDVQLSRVSGYYISFGLGYSPQHCDGCDSSVGIATCYALDGPGIEFLWGRDFPRLSRPALVPTQPPRQWATVSFAGGKAAGTLCYSPSYRIEVRVWGELYLYHLLPIVLYDSVIPSEWETQIDKSIMSLVKQ